MKTLEQAQAIINGSKQYEFGYNEEGQMSVLTITGYYSGEELKLDPSKLTPEMLEALQPEEVEEEHSIVVSEQVDRFDENGKWCGTDELSVPVSETNCERPNRKSFYCWLCALYPQYDWQFDDGEDWDEDDDTDYIQYTANINDGKPGHIMLACYNKTKKEQA